MQASQLSEFLRVRGREPSVLSKDPEERSLASWVARQRHNHRIGLPLSPEDELTLSSQGYPGILRRNGRESCSNRLTESVCLWMLENGMEPRGTSVDPSEACLAGVLDRKRTRTKKYGSDVGIASAMGLPNILDKLSKEEKSNAAADQYCRWVQEHEGRKPSARSEDKTERSLAAWLHNRKSVARGVVPGNTYESDLRIFSHYGLQGLLEIPG